MTTETAGAEGPRRKGWILLTTSLVSSLIMLDSNIVAVSLPTIGRSLGASFSAIEWVVNAYLLTYAALLLAAGAYADLYGRKRAMVIGLFVFGVASAACGLARSPWMLNGARAIQGVGGSLLLTAALAVLTATFTGPERTRAFAVWGACLGVALTAGPILGGAITALFGWRWVFLVNVPLCVVLIVAIFAVIQESHDPNARRLDIFGVVTFSPALFLLVWALTDGNEAGWSSRTILLRFFGAALLFVAFVCAEARQARPMIELRLFKDRPFMGAVFAMLGYGAAAQVMVFYLPLFLQNAYGLPPVKAGFAMIPFALPMVLAPRLLASTLGHHSGRTTLSLGLAIVVVGNLSSWWIAKEGYGYAGFVVTMLITGTGAGVLNGETVKVFGATVPPERAGMASGLASTTRFIGILIAVAGMGAILSYVAHGAAGMPSAGSRFTSTQLAFARGFATDCLVAAGVAAISALLTARFLWANDATNAVPASAEHGKESLCPM
jgi:EmrB/QacA subfamily drug resistance transporter